MSKTRLSPNAVMTVDKIIRRLRDALEEGAKRNAQNDQRSEATPDDVTVAATVIFESDCTPLIRG